MLRCALLLRTSVLASPRCSLQCTSAVNHMHDLDSPHARNFYLRNYSTSKTLFVSRYAGDNDDSDSDYDSDSDFDYDTDGEYIDEFTIGDSGGNNAARASKQNRSKWRRKFLDKARIDVNAGTGGNGCVSFEVIKSFKKRPDGGHGGSGGSVVLRAVQDMDSFSHFNKFHFNADDGGNGGNKGQTGRRGATLMVDVPCGTMVRKIEKVDLGFGDVEERLVKLGELDEDGAEMLVATGGRPGLGNRILTGKPFQLMPRDKLPGGLGEVATLQLELKLLADVGLVGFPNAGKSSLLARVSRAKPKIAPYAFTTLHPSIGVVEFPDTSRFTIADLPGIVEGANENIGLGLEFLRHIERTKVLVYVIDVSAGGAHHAAASIAADAAAATAAAAVETTATTGAVGSDTSRNGDSDSSSGGDNSSSSDSSSELDSDDDGDEKTKEREELRLIDPDSLPPWEQLHLLQEELRVYDPSLDLVTKPSIVLANKMDLPGAEENLAVLRKRTKLPVFASSVLAKEGLQNPDEEGDHEEMVWVVDFEKEGWGAVQEKEEEEDPHAKDLRTAVQFIRFLVGKASK